MIKKHYLTLLSLVLILSCAYGQSGGLQFRRQLERDPHTAIAFSVHHTEGALGRLLNDRTVRVKSVTPEWIYIQASAQWVADAQRNGVIDGFYFEHSIPVALNDTSLVTHHVTEVHDGTNGLQLPFTGKDVIIGYVDQGIDYNHPDFIDSNGQTRVLYYWDHTLPNAANTPLPYGYGQLWTQSEIQAGTCGSNEESTAHGTSVAGAGSSNARANGQQKGVAPDSKIIIVETNFELPNWTLTIADACDFIFQKAEELGLPAVVNLSLGSYLGSHDGNDPAAILMEQLLDEQPGRIIVSAAGNSGAWGKYHVHGEVTGDTSFVWFLNNPSGAIAANSIYFDVWTDLADAGWTYALAANKNTGDFAERAETVYRDAIFGVGSSPILDTLYNGSNRIATIELYPEIVGSNLHLEVFISQVDSTAYYYAFKTTGSGNYDAWSGAAMGLNAIVETLPSAGVYPPIVQYNLPDGEQTIVSSWNCSEKVISVGNFRNRFGHTDKNGNYYQPAPSYTAVVGELSPNSSKGPNRHGITKPDISACGDVSLSAGPMWVFSFPGANSVIDIDNWHVRNGGTSMASPIVAGIAALYLEKCKLGTYATFKDDLLSTAMADGFTGTVPNNAYGYGKAHALNTLLASNYPATVDGPLQFCGSDTAYAVIPGPVTEINWNGGGMNTFVPMTGAGTFYFTAHNSEGCISLSDTLTVAAGDIPPTPVITATGATLSTDPYPDLQWYENGVAMPGETGSSIVITLPNQNDYTVVATGTTGCEAESAPYNASAGIAEGEPVHFTAWPNPSSGILHIQSEQTIEELALFDLSGNLVLSIVSPEATIDLNTLSLGTYLLHLRSESAAGWMKIVRN